MMVSTWTTVTPGLNTARSSLGAGGVGIQTAALAYGGGI
jgi:hypothetical protein